MHQNHYDMRKLISSRWITFETCSGFRSFLQPPKGWLISQRRSHVCLHSKGLVSSRNDRYAELLLDKHMWAFISPAADFNSCRRTDENQWCSPSHTGRSEWRKETVHSQVICFLLRVAIQLWILNISPFTDTIHKCWTLRGVEADQPNASKDDSQIVMNKQKAMEWKLNTLCYEVCQYWNSRTHSISGTYVSNFTPKIDFWTCSVCSFLFSYLGKIQEL